MIYLRPVTRENLDTVLALEVMDFQKGFVSSTAEALAQAYVYSEQAYPFAVYADSEIVGFIMMGYYELKSYYTLWKFMIDRKYQGRGYGRKALELGIAYMRDRFHADEIYTGVVPENAKARGLYESMGFSATGLFENGMEEMCLRIKQKGD
ncbi:MAG: GNAT family N-acetyltransferase [Lachnospiraceae bacterium]|nr:GNAT family N-acetyltransferase [Lachnospiraceae bacterium]